MHPPPPRFRYQMIAATLTRLIINIPHRMIYPFLPAFSRGLGVPLEAITLILSVRGGLGMTAPFFGIIPDRLGQRSAMLIGLGVFTGCLGLVAAFPSYATFFIAIIGIVIARFIFDPALQAYLSDRSAYSQRGLVIALTEIGWSGAALIGFPVVGFLIAWRGWQTPFWPLAGLGLAALVVMARLIPPTAPPVSPTATARPNQLALVWLNPRILAAMSVGLFTSAANELLNTVYALWLERTFNLSLQTLALAVAIALGVAELAGEGLVMSMVDRWGKRRSIAGGLAVSVIAYFLLPSFAHSLPLALAGLFFIFMAFEFSIVASIPLISELLPEARGTAMSSNAAFHMAGRMVGALLGGGLFQFGFIWTGVAAALMNLMALGVIVFFVRERPGG